ncbi:MAG TPA: hypothetical protein VIV40_34045, partial [Kofleriaceae bacterium]
MRRSVVVVALTACSFEHGAPLTQLDEAGVVADTPSTPKDAGPDARACPAAPGSCKSFTCPGSTSCYYVCGGTAGGARSWSSAQGSCANGGLGCLATINDQAEQDCITAQTSP